MWCKHLAEWMEHTGITKWMVPQVKCLIFSTDAALLLPTWCSALNSHHLQHCTCQHEWKKFRPVTTFHNHKIMMPTIHTGILFIHFYQNICCIVFDILFVGGRGFFFLARVSLFLQHSNSKVPPIIQHYSQPICSTCKSWLVLSQLFFRPIHANPKIMSSWTKITKIRNTA